MIFHYFRTEKIVDLQLPKREVTETAQPVVLNTSVPQRTFVEKTITNISTGDSDDEKNTQITFKKRKFGNRNVRKRFDDD